MGTTAYLSKDFTLTPVAMAEKVGLGDDRFDSRLPQLGIVISPQVFTDPACDLRERAGYRFHWIPLELPKSL
jgi:hypothetical protein